MSTDTQISFKDLNLESWSSYGKQILESENQYPEDIQSSEENYLFALSKPNAVASVLLVDNQYAGNAVCCPFTQEEVDELMLHDTLPVEGACYLYNFIINENFQGKGLGLALINEIVEKSRNQGYKILSGHFRPNGSLSLAKKIGAKELKPYPNWGETGETYIYCELNLASSKQ